MVTAAIWTYLSWYRGLIIGNNSGAFNWEVAIHSLSHLFLCTIYLVIFHQPPFFVVVPVQQQPHIMLTEHSLFVSLQNRENYALKYHVYWILMVVLEKRLSSLLGIPYGWKLSNKSTAWFPANHKVLGTFSAFNWLHFKPTVHYTPDALVQVVFLLTKVPSIFFRIHNWPRRGQRTSMETRQG